MTGQANGVNQARTEVIWSNRPIAQQATLFDAAPEPLTLTTR